MGIAPTKTLAKVANNIAKKQMHNGVFDLRNEHVKNIILQNFPVGELWGVGRQWVKKLNALHIENASQLLERSESYLKKHFNVIIVRLLKELNGTSCLSLEEVSLRKSIICSRSFGDPVTTLVDLSEAISHFCATACEKARKQKTKARGIYVYFRTSAFSHKDYYCTAADTSMFVQSSNDTCFITMVAKKILKQLYRPGFDYKKAGIVLLNMQPESIIQDDFFQQKTDDNKQLMLALDGINKRFGRRVLCLASEGVSQHWKVKQIYRSPRYTTSWSELPIVF